MENRSRFISRQIPKPHLQFFCSTDNATWRHAHKFHRRIVSVVNECEIKGERERERKVDAYATSLCSCTQVDVWRPPINLTGNATENSLHSLSLPSPQLSLLLQPPGTLCSSCQNSNWPQSGTKVTVCCGLCGATACAACNSALSTCRVG